MHDHTGNRWWSLGWGLAAGLMGVGFLAWNSRSASQPGGEDLNPRPGRETAAAVVQATNRIQTRKPSAPVGGRGHVSKNDGPGGAAGEPGLAGKIQRLGAGRVPEMVLWTGICEDWNVPVDLRSHCVWKVFAVTSERERLRRDVEEFQRKMPMVNDAVAADGTEIPDLEGRAKASVVMEKIRRRVIEGSEVVEQGMAKTTAELTELTGITDPDFYTRLFAISPRVTMDQLAPGDVVSTGEGGTPP